MKSKTSGVLRTSFRIREIGGAIEILVNIGIAGHFLTELSICRLGSLTCLLIRLSKDLDLQDSGFIQITSAWPNCFWEIKWSFKKWCTEWTWTSRLYRGVVVPVVGLEQCYETETCFDMDYISHEPSQNTLGRFCEYHKKSNRAP